MLDKELIKTLLCNLFLTYQKWAIYQKEKPAISKEEEILIDDQIASFERELRKFNFDFISKLVEADQTIIEMLESELEYDTEAISWEEEEFEEYLDEFLFNFYLEFVWENWTDSDYQHAFDVVCSLLNTFNSVDDDEEADWFVWHSSIFYMWGPYSTLKIAGELNISI